LSYITLNEFFLELISEREALKHDLFRKHPGESKDEEESRIRRKYDEIQTLYKRIDSLTEEKEEICEKLFLM